MKYFKMLLLLFVFSLSLRPTTLGAQDESSCRAIVQTAIASSDVACQNTGRNQICFGNTQIDVTPREGASDFAFIQSGDIMDVTDVQSLRLYALDEETGAWGVALMKIQANIPGTMPGQNVTFVLFGDVEVENAGKEGGGDVEETPVTLEIQVNGINLRTGPSTDYSVYTSFSGPATVDGRIENSEWLRLRTPGGEGYVWVSAAHVTIEGDVSTLPVVDPNDSGMLTIMVQTNGEIQVYDTYSSSRNRGSMSGSFPADGRTEDGQWLRTFWGGDTGHVWFQASDVTPNSDIMALEIIDLTPDYGPMQAFFFKAGVGDAPCEEAPDSGILVQTPEGIGEINISVNGVDFALGSTAYISGYANGEAVPGDITPFNVSVFDGSATYPGGTIYPGLTQAFVEDSDGNYSAWGKPYPTSQFIHETLPIDLLPDPIYDPQWGRLHDSEIVYNYYAPDDPNGCVAVLLHNAGADMSSWYPWMIAPLLHDGWGVFTPDMPGHGQSLGEPVWDDWLAITNDSVSHLQDMYGYDCATFIGSSIGANTALAACEYWSEVCICAVALSPGLDYGGYNTIDTVGLLGDTPVYIITGQNDQYGASGDVAQQIAAAGNNVSTNIYDTDIHGSYMSGYFPIGADVIGWIRDISD